MEAVRAGGVPGGALGGGDRVDRPAAGPSPHAALLAAYQLTMSSEVEAAFGRELERLSKHAPRKG